MLADPDIHVVSICSYHQQHKEQAIAAARAGKHLIVEKPLALSLADVREIEQAVRAAGVGSASASSCGSRRSSATSSPCSTPAASGGCTTARWITTTASARGIANTSGSRTKEACGSSLLAAGCHAMDALAALHGRRRGGGLQLRHEVGAPDLRRLRVSDHHRHGAEVQGRPVGKCASVIDCWQPYYFHTHLVGSEGSLLDNRFHSNALHGDDRQHWNELPLQAGGFRRRVRSSVSNPVRRFLRRPSTKAKTCRSPD